MPELNILRVRNYFIAVQIEVRHLKAILLESINCFIDKSSFLQPLIINKGFQFLRSYNTVKVEVHAVLKFELSHIKIELTVKIIIKYLQKQLGKSSYFHREWHWSRFRFFGSLRGGLFWSSFRFFGSLRDVLDEVWSFKRIFQNSFRFFGSLRDVLDEVWSLKRIFQNSFRFLGSLRDVLDEVWSLKRIFQNSFRFLGSLRDVLDEVWSLKRIFQNSFRFLGSLWDVFDEVWSDKRIFQNSFRFFGSLRDVLDLFRDEVWSDKIIFQNRFIRDNWQIFFNFLGYKSLSLNCVEESRGRGWNDLNGLSSCLFGNSCRVWD
jgi:hypothetical protein